MRYYPLPFTGNDPRKGWRIPLNEIKYNEQRDEETGYGYFGARYMDHELMTMWLSVDPMAGKYPGISPYAYCSWNPVKSVIGESIGYVCRRSDSWPVQNRYLTETLPKPYRNHRLATTELHRTCWPADISNQITGIHRNYQFSILNFQFSPACGVIYKSNYWISGLQPSGLGGL